MRRREFIAAQVGALLTCTTQTYLVRAQAPRRPTIGFLSSQSRDSIGSRLVGFHQGLSEAGFVENSDGHS